MRVFGVGLSVFPKCVHTVSMDYQQIDDDELKKLSLRDLLAIDRTALANERTFLAYARTAIMLVATAVTLLKLFPDNEISRFTGMFLVPVATIVIGVGIRRYWVLASALRGTRAREH